MNAPKTLALLTSLLLASCSSDPGRASFSENVGDDSQPPRIVLTELLLSTREQPLRPALPEVAGGELVLSHRQYAFSVEFAALHYSSPRKNRPSTSSASPRGRRRRQG